MIFFPEDIIGVLRIGTQFSETGKTLIPIGSSPKKPSLEKCVWQDYVGANEAAIGCSYSDNNNVIYDIQGTLIIAIHINRDAKNIWEKPLVFGIKSTDTPNQIFNKIKKSGKKPNHVKISSKDFKARSICTYIKDGNPKRICFSFDARDKLNQINIANMAYFL